MTAEEAPAADVPAAVSAPVEPVVAVPAVAVESASAPVAATEASTPPAPVEAVVVGAEPVKAVEPAPVDGEPKPEDAPVVEAAPAYADFKLPEGMASVPEQISAYTNILGKYKMPQEAGQELLDFHASQVKQAINQVEQRQQDVFDNTRRDWVKRTGKEFGNRRDTVIEDAKWAVSQFGGDKKQVQELWDVLAFTGAGDHPAVIRAFGNAARKMRERGAPQHGVPQNSAPSDPVSRRYGPRKA